MFDFEIKNIVEKIYKIAKKKFPHRSWHCEVIFYEDTDYQIRLTSSWGGFQDIFHYSKSKGILSYYKKKDLPIKMGKEIKFNPLK